MQSHPEHSDDPRPESGHGGLYIAIAIAAVVAAIVVLHLMGVVGPSAQ